MAAAVVVLIMRPGPLAPTTYFLVWGVVRRTDGWAAHGAVQLNVYHRAGFVPELLRASPRLCYISNYLSLWGEYYGTGWVRVIVPQAAPACVSPVSIVDHRSQIVYNRACHSVAAFARAEPTANSARRHHATVPLVAGAWLLLCPPQFKLFGIAMLTIMQLVFGASLLLYMFPLAAALVVTPLLPAFFWDKVVPVTTNWVEHDAAAVAEVVLGPAVRLPVAPEAPPPGTLRRAFLGGKAVTSDAIRIIATVSRGGERGGRSDRAWRTVRGVSVS